MSPFPSCPADTNRRRAVFVVTSPRLPAGLLTAQAWDLARAYPVFAATENDQTLALKAGGARVTIVEPCATRLLEEVEAHTTVVWLMGPDGDQDLVRHLGSRLAQRPDLAEFELVYGSWDPPGARLLDAVAVVDRLLAPGGDPWLSGHINSDRDLACAHESLARYVLEEAYEAYDAIRAHDSRSLREELGDVLFQIILHSSIAGRPEGGYTIDDVAGDLVAKLIRRNPHVYGGAEVKDISEISRNWERIKRQEKSRTSVMDGIALSQPALTLAAELVSRAERVGVSIDNRSLSSSDDEESYAIQLFAMVRRAMTAGCDLESSLRRFVLGVMEEVRVSESRLREDNPGLDPRDPCDQDYAQSSVD